jgi:hypothetical protein
LFVDLLQKRALLRAANHPYVVDDSDDDYAAADVDDYAADGDDDDDDGDGLSIDRIS